MAAERPDFLPERVIDVDIVPVGMESRSDQVRRVINRKKGAALAGGVLLGAPFLFGIAQGLDPVDAAIYGSVRILTIGDDDPPDADFVKEFRSHIQTGDDALQGDIEVIIASTEDTVREALLIAGGAGVAFAVVNSAMKYGERRKNRIIEGNEALDPKGEQIIVLAGEGNNIVDELISSGERCVPIYENSRSAQQLVRVLGDNDPQYVNLGLDGTTSAGFSYLDSDGWNRLKLDAANLISSKNGHRYLLVAGLGMKRDMELSHRRESINVSQDNLRSAGLRLRQRLQQGALVEDRDIIELYVASNLIEHPDIQRQGETVSDRELAFSTGVDIYIDSWAVALGEILGQIEKYDLDKIRIATSSQEYQSRFREHLPLFAASRGKGVEIQDGDPKPDDLWLVYEGNSEATFMAARRLRKIKPFSRIIALVTDDLRDQAEKGGLYNIDLINTSATIATMIRDVRFLLREGITPDQIQQSIDDCLLPLQRV